MKLHKIPDEIKQLNQWVCATKDNKIPMVATDRYPASSTNPDTWVGFDKAVDSVKSGMYDYLGFVFNDNGIVGIDIDSGFDADGFLSELAIDIIGKCGSYTEKSKSGRGFHILIKGDIPFKGKNNLNGVEIYKQSRFFIMTGNTILNDKIIENQKAIDYVVDKYFTKQRGENTQHNTCNKIYNPVWDSFNGRTQLRPRYPEIQLGCRNICLTSLAGNLHTIGYSPQQILNEISYCNKKSCRPKLSDNELINIVNSITKYKR